MTTATTGHSDQKDSITLGARDKDKDKEKEKTNRFDLILYLLQEDTATTQNKFIVK